MWLNRFIIFRTSTCRTSQSDLVVSYNVKSVDYSEKKMLQNQRVLIVRRYFETKSYKEVKKSFQDQFPGVPIPANSTILRLVRRFNETGRVDELPRTGRPRTAVAPNKVKEVRAVLNENRQTSTRRIAQRVGISQRSVRRSLKLLHVKPYKLLVVHELHPPDSARRKAYCRWMRRFIRQKGRLILNHVYFSDEAWFHLSGYVNAQNYRIWNAEKPNIVRETPLHPEKVGVWCAISRAQIIGPIFFDKTVNAAEYRKIVEEFLDRLPLLDRRVGYFQQDGATAHTANVTMDFLRTHFEDRIISRPLWPPRSPDLTPLDAFLWGYLKDKVFELPVNTTNELKERITHEIQAINSKMLSNVYANMERRLQVCIQAGGGHFQHLL